MTIESLIYKIVYFYFECKGWCQQREYLQSTLSALLCYLVHNMRKENIQYLFIVNECEIYRKI